MLIEAPYQKSDVVTLKSAGGEEILGRFEEENDNQITLTKPMTLMVTQDGVGLGPMAFTLGSEKVTFFKASILMISKTDKDYASQYLQSTTGIQMTT